MAALNDCIAHDSPIKPEKPSAWTSRVLLSSSPKERLCPTARPFLLA
jgi:hypothetical protein